MRPSRDTLTFISVILGERQRILRAHPRRIATVPLAFFLAASCGPPPAPPGPGEARGLVPDLSGYKVMVLPIQQQYGVPEGLTVDSELAYALRSRGKAVTWAFPPEIDEALQRSPGVRVHTNALPVQIFKQAEVNRIGDPLFGILLRLGGLTGADVALIPVELRYGPEGAYILSIALVGVRTGRVSYYGVMEGNPGAADDPASLASVAEVVARTILPLG